MSGLRRRVLVLAAALIATLPSSNGQGTFQNLGFESPISPLISGNPPYVVFSDAFPGWAGYIGGVQTSLAVYNAAALDTSTIALISTNVTLLPGGVVGVIAGSYTALLQAGVRGIDFTPADTRLSQTGIVPQTAQSLRFRAYNASGIGPLHVSLGGQLLVVSPLANGANFTLYGADIRPWQGQLAQLDFTVLARNPHDSNNNWLLDSVVFSDLPVPEPSALSIFALGALVLGWRMRKP